VKIRCIGKIALPLLDRAVAPTSTPADHNPVRPDDWADCLKTVRGIAQAGPMRSESYTSSLPLAETTLSHRSSVSTRPSFIT